MFEESKTNVKAAIVTTMTCKKFRYLNNFIGGLFNFMPMTNGFSCNGAERH